MPDWFNDIMSRKYLPVIHGASEDRLDEIDTIKNAACIADSLRTLGYETEIISIDMDLRQIGRIADAKPSAVFNLVEALEGDGRLGFLSCAALDHAGIAYTGAPLTGYIQSSSKLLTKALLKSAGISTPDFWTGISPVGQRVIVKSVWEHASYGMDQGSVVDGKDAAGEIRARQARFGGQFFSEIYIPGREFNIAILETRAGPRVLPLAEMLFDDLPDGVLPIIDYDAKWHAPSVGEDPMKRHFGIEKVSPALAKGLADTALACWDAADLAGYARIDFRVDEDDNVYVLEINANPCLAPDAGFIAAAAVGGFGYADVIGAIVDAALLKRVF